MSLSDAAKIEIVEALYAACGSGDFDTAEELLTDDFFITEEEALPFAGRYEGKTALRELYPIFASTFDLKAVPVEQRLAGKDCVIAILTLEFTDETLEPVEMLELFRFRGDKVCEIKPYYFSAAQVAAAAAAKKS